MTQQELKQWITEDMKAMDYKIVPPFDFEVIDCREYDTEQKKAYYQNLTKRALEQEFDKMMLNTMTFENNLKNNQLN
jgi:protein associated with RNAse G/E